MSHLAFMFHFFSLSTAAWWTVIAIQVFLTVVLKKVSIYHLYANYMV